MGRKIERNDEGNDERKENGQKGKGRKMMGGWMRWDRKGNMEFEILDWNPSWKGEKGKGKNKKGGEKDKEG